MANKEGYQDPLVWILFSAMLVGVIAFCLVLRSASAPPYPIGEPVSLHLPLTFAGNPDISSVTIEYDGDYYFVENVNAVHESPEIVGYEDITTEYSYPFPFPHTKTRTNRTAIIDDPRVNSTRFYESGENVKIDAYDTEGNRLYHFPEVTIPHVIHTNRVHSPDHYIMFIGFITDENSYAWVSDSTAEFEVLGGKK